MNTDRVFLFLLFLFLPVEALLGQEVIREEPEPQKEEELSAHQMFFTIGFAYRTAKTVDYIDAQLAQHVDRLKKGLNIQGSYAYFPVPSMGASIKYTQFFSSNTTFDLNTDVNILFIGGGVAARNFVSSRVLLNASLHLGYVVYKELDTISGISVELTGKTVGLDGLVTINVLMNEKISLQFGAGYQLASLNKIKDASGNSYEFEEPESLNRIDINTGFKIHF